MRSVMLHGALATAGLLAAWFTWQRQQEPTASRTDVVVWDCAPERFERVQWVGKLQEVTLERRGGEARGEGLWVTVVRKPPEEAASEAPEKTAKERAETASSQGDAGPGGGPVDGGTDAGASDAGAADGGRANGHHHRRERPKPKLERTERLFVAGEAAEAYLERLLPLRAVRSLGEVEADLLEQIGLKEPEERLTIACGGKTRRFVLGGSAYGSGDRYLRAEDGGPVHLLRSALVNDLRAAEARLMQRALHRFEPKEVARLVVRAGGAERTLLHRNRLEPKLAEWVDAAQPDRRNELFGNWLLRVEKLRAVRYLPPGVSPDAEQDGAGAAGSLEPVVSLRYLDEDGEQLGFLEVVRRPPGKEGARPDYFARSEATGGAWVELTRSVAEQVAEDAAAVAGGSEAPAGGG